MKGGEKVTEINRIRKERGMSIPQFTEALGVSPSYTLKLLYGNRPVTLAVIRKVVKAFPDVDINRFIEVQ